MFPARTIPSPVSLVERLVESRAPWVRRTRDWARLGAPALATAYSVYYDALAAGTRPDPAQLVVFALTGATLYLIRRAPALPIVAAPICWALTESCSFVIVMAYVVAERRLRGWWLVLLLYLAIHPIGLVPDPCAYRAGHVTLPSSTAPLLGVALPAAAGALVGEARRVVAAREERLRVQIDLATAQAAQAADAERMRLSRDMHDLVGRDLSRIALHATAIAATTGEARTARLADRIARAAAGCVEDVRYVVGMLREHAADDHPARLLRDGVEAARDHGLAVHAAGLGALVDLPEPTRAALEAVGAEALHNAVKHAPGSTVTVTVTTTENAVRLRVADHRPPAAVTVAEPADARGRAGDAEAIDAVSGGRATDADRGVRQARGHGLAIASERLAAVDGSLAIDASDTDGGFTLTAEVPR